MTAITLTPANSVIALTTTQQFTPTESFSDGTSISMNASFCIWSSSNTSVATIDANGLVTSLATGTTVITATNVTNGISGATTLTVSIPVAISAAPYNPRMAVGTTHLFSATATLPPNDTTQSVTPWVSWNSSDPGIATVGTPTGINGLVTAIAAGTTIIMATDLTTSLSGTTLLTVSNTPLTTITITPHNPILISGTTQQFSATGTYADNTTQDLTAVVLWSSSVISVATISSSPGSITNGLATLSVNGTTTIKAIDPITQIAGSTTLKVTP